MRLIRISALSFLTILVLARCGSSSGGGAGATVTMNIKAAGQSNSRGFDFNPVRQLLADLMPPAPDLRADSVGQNAPINLEYFINFIEVCQSMTTSGTAFSNQQNCISVYSNPLGDSSSNPYHYDPSTDYSGLANTARTDTTNFTDLMDSTKRKALGQNITVQASQAGDYNWGIITWFPVVKFKAAVPINGGSNTYYTHDYVASSASNSGTLSSPNYSTTSSTSLTTAPTGGDGGLSIVLHNNGGSYFAFQKPFHIASDGSTYQLDLAFNPEGLIKGFANGVGGTSGGILSDGAGGTGNRLGVPQLTLTPIPHLSTETVVRDHYLVHYNNAGTVFDIRLDLYRLSSGTSLAGPFFGLESKTMYTSLTTTGIYDFPNPTAILAQPSGVANELEFMNWDGTALVNHFIPVDTTVHTTLPFTAPTMVTINCTSPNGFSFTGCTSGSVTMTYELNSEDTL